MKSHKVSTPTEERLVITHYWSMMNLSNPPGVTFKTNDGRFIYAFVKPGNLPEKIYSFVNKPCPIIGRDPDTKAYGYPFGEWISINEWLSHKEEDVEIW